MTDPLRTLRTAALLLLLLSAAGAWAQLPATLPASQTASRPAVPQTGPGSELHVFVLTFGPGDDPWEKFGHNAIRVIDDSVSGDYHDVAYNWGTFDFDSGFYFRFVQGRLNYAMEPQRGPEMLDFYKNVENRSIHQQELNLSPAQKLKLKSALLWTNTNAHRYYRYDYYRDNCSTRVRDAVDGLTGGLLAAKTQMVPSGTTFRWHTRRLIGSVPWLYVALQGVLGQPVDRVISQWDEMFLPMALRDRLNELQIPDPAGGDAFVPLVKEENVLYQSTRPDNPARPPDTVQWFLLVGLVLSGIYLALGHFVRQSTRARWALVVLSLPWLLLMGLAGPFLVYAWFCTDHVVTARNENILHVSPLMLPVILLFPMLVLGKHRWASATRWLTLSAAAIAVIATTLKATPAFYQVNDDIISLTLPVNLAIAFIAWKLSAKPAAQPAELATRSQASEVKPKPKKQAKSR
jgi:hypothetical protein